MTKQNVFPLLGAVTLSACLASCGNDDTADTGADGGSESSGNSTSTTQTSLSTSTTSAGTTTTMSTTSVDSSGTETDSGTETGPYPLAPGDNQGPSTDTLDVEAAPGSTTTIGFTWYQTAGWPASADLSIHVAGHREPLAQVFTQGGAPFFRSGLEVVELEARASYDVSITLRRDHSAEITLSFGREVLSKQTIELPANLEVSGLQLLTPAANMLAAPVGLGEIAVD